jgi:hypothetical protein
VLRFGTLSWLPKCPEKEIAPLFITGFTNGVLSSLDFSGVPSSLEAGSSSITITITGGVTVDEWYIDMTGPETLSPVPISVPPDKVTFTVPILLSGFYNVNVIAKVGGVHYSGSFGLIVE